MPARHVARAAGPGGRVRRRARLAGRGTQLHRPGASTDFPLQSPGRRPQHRSCLRRRCQQDLPALSRPRGRSVDRHGTSQRLRSLHLRLPRNICEEAHGQCEQSSRDRLRYQPSYIMRFSDAGTMFSAEFK